MNNEEAIKYLKNLIKNPTISQDPFHTTKIAIDTVLNYIEELEKENAVKESHIKIVSAYNEELEEKLKIQTENYNSAYEDINWLCGKRTGKTVESALILRKEILKLPEGRTYGIRRCKNNIICVIPEEVTLNSKIRDKIEELEEEDLEIYDTDSEDLIVAKYEQRAVLDFAQQLLNDKEEK